jgi:hypothetical protein
MTPRIVARVNNGNRNGNRNGNGNGNRGGGQAETSA